VDLSTAFLFVDVFLPVSSPGFTLRTNFPENRVFITSGWKNHDKPCPRPKDTPRGVFENISVWAIMTLCGGPKHL
jgi:hypothetical protein